MAEIRSVAVERRHRKSLAPLTINVDLQLEHFRRWGLNRINYLLFQGQTVSRGQNHVLLLLRKLDSPQEIYFCSARETFCAEIQFPAHVDL